MRPRQRPVKRRWTTRLNTPCNGGLGILSREESRLREGKIPVEPLGQGVSVACGEDELIERTHDYV
jgi:hypothetical protein